MLGMNLHGIVSGVISSVQPEVPAVLYCSAGEVNDKGKVKPLYDKGEDITTRIQTESDATLYHADRVGMNEVNRKLYLYSKSTPDGQVAGIIRPFSRGGDMIKSDDGTWWLVTAIIEDFSKVGWMSVRVTLQTIPPDFSYSYWYGEDG